MEQHTVVLECAGHTYLVQLLPLLIDSTVVA